MTLFRHWHEVQTFGRTLNASFIGWFQGEKIRGAMEFRDFRRSIINLWPKKKKSHFEKGVCWYRLWFAKCFVGGKQILDYVLSVDECVDSRWRSERPWVIQRLTLNWDRLLYIKWRMVWANIEILDQAASPHFCFLSYLIGFLWNFRGLRRGILFRQRACCYLASSFSKCEHGFVSLKKYNRRVWEVFECTVRKCIAHRWMNVSKTAPILVGDYQWFFSGSSYLLFRPWQRLTRLLQLGIMLLSVSKESWF